MYLPIIAFSFCLTLGFPNFASANDGENFDGHTFLKWDYVSQKSYMQTGISMAGAIAERVRPDILQCLLKWFPDNAEIQEQRFQEMLGYVREHPQFSPTAIVLSTIQKHCGKFKDAKS